MDGRAWVKQKQVGLSPDGRVRAWHGLEYAESRWVDNIIATILPKPLATQPLYCGALEHLRLALEGFTSGVA